MAHASLIAIIRKYGLGSGFSKTLNYLASVGG